MRLATVNEALDNFRLGLNVLIPVAGRAHIRWSGEQVYDPWERIEQAMFYCMFESICYNTIGPIIKNVNKYKEEMFDYHEKSYIYSDLLGGRSVLMAFECSGYEFGIARLKPIDSLHKIAGAEFKIPVHNAVFGFSALYRDGSRVDLQSLKYED